LAYPSFFHSGVHELDEIYDPAGEGEAVVVEEEWLKEVVEEVRWLKRR
jgi:hypothetical protein